MKIKFLNNKISVFLAMILIFLGLVLTNLLGGKLLGAIRLDLTSNHVFTLSAGTKKILAKIDEPITLKLFFSRQVAKDNPFFLNFASRVEEFLKLYQKNSRQKIILQFIDPAPFTEEEDQAVHYGLQGVPINNDGGELYFGLVGVNSLVGKEAIPFIQPNREGYLEYDISQLIAKLTKQALNKIAVISSIPLDGKNTMVANGRSWLIWQQMQQHFELKMLEPNLKEIPADTKVLFLINTGEDLEFNVAKAIDEFVLNGGNILLLVDPFSEIKQNIKSEKLNANEETTPEANSKKIPISTLLAAWGIEYDPSKIVASRALAKNVRYMHQGKEIIGLYPLWIDLGANELNRKDILTANLTKLTFVSPGTISANSNLKGEFSPLVELKTDHMLIDQSDFTTYKENPASLLKNYKPASTPVALAARLTGKVGSAFGSKISQQTNIVMVANVDFIYDNFWANVQNFLGNSIFVPTSGNATFILNSLDNLTGSNELINIRSKDSYTKGFDKIRELELKSQNKFHQTEEALLQRIEETKKKLAAMDQKSLSREHLKEEEHFRKDLLTTRKELREVRRSLREDIKILENRIKFFTITFIPLLIVGSFVGYCFVGRRNFYKLLGQGKYVERSK